jgi:hypothetical protein
MIIPSFSEFRHAGKDEGFLRCPENPGWAGKACPTSLGPACIEPHETGPTAAAQIHHFHLPQRLHLGPASHPQQQQDQDVDVPGVLLPEASKKTGKKIDRKWQGVKFVIFK